MICWLTLEEIFEIHAATIQSSGGSPGVRDRGALESALIQPLQTFGGADLYPTLIDWAASLGFFLIRNHPFIDGNKRVGHAALDITLQLNGFEILADEDEQESVILALAAGNLTIQDFTAWVHNVIVPFDPSSIEQ